MKDKKTVKIAPNVSLSMSEVKEDEDFYINDKGQFVFTEAYHLKRGVCCENGCRHCPFDFKKKGK